MKQAMTVQVLKYGGQRHYEWTSNVVEETPNYVLAFNRPKRTLIHHTKDKQYVYDNYSLELFLKEEWYNVCLDIERDGTVQYYCNIGMPPKIENNTLQFVDLDLDIVYRAGQWTVVDEDEFAEHQKRFGYPQALINEALQAKERLLENIEQQKFPFDGFLEQACRQLLSTYEGEIHAK